MKHLEADELFSYYCKTEKKYGIEWHVEGDEKDFDDLDEIKKALSTFSLA